MSDGQKDNRKRATPTSSSGESSAATSTPKPTTKKAKPFDPVTEAQALGERRSKASFKSAASDASEATIEPGTPGPQSPSAANNEVFDPANKTVADISLDDTEELFELAMTAGNYEEAQKLAVSDTRRRRVWLAVKNKVGFIGISN